MPELDLENLKREASKPGLSEVIKALEQDTLGAAQTVAPAIVYGMSELSAEEGRQVAPIWRELSAAYRLQVLRQLLESSEASFEFSYREIATLSLEDASERVRAAAVDLLWTDESLGTMKRLMVMARNDESALVRARALAGLGRYILRGEYGEIPAHEAKEAQELALQMHVDEAQPVEVRCRALEALANSNHAQAAPLIRRAYADGDHMLTVSAIYAMGRSCDKQWRETLLEELAGDDSELVYEAIQACGHIQIEDSLQLIQELALSEDDEIQLMAVWAMGEIGGKRAFDILSRLQETTEDEVLLEAIDEALDAASFSLTMPALDFEFDDG